MEKDKQNQIIIYKNKSGQTEIDVKVEKDTVWLTQKQIALLMGTKRPAITKHLNNIFKTQELDENLVCSKMEHTTKHGAIAEKTQIKKVKYYNLDAIISVGYRVNSKRATQFRIWAKNTLRNYLINGYVVNQQKLALQEEKFKELQRSIAFIEKKADNYLLQGKSRELLSLISEYTKSLTILRQYDEGKIKVEKSKKPIFKLEYQGALNFIRAFKAELKRDNEAGDLFGKEINHEFESVVGVIYQTFDGRELYRGLEEKAAHLLYLIIKDHPFSDGNKRIASLLFIYFLKNNDFLYKNNFERKITDNTLISLALLVATSDPKEKNVVIEIIISLLQ